MAAGTIIACLAAQELDWFETSETRRVAALFKAFDLPVEGPKSMNKADYVKHMKRDKKVEAGSIRFVLPKGIGNAVVTKAVTDDILSNVLS